MRPRVGARSRHAYDAMTSAALSQLRDLFLAPPAEAAATQVATRAIPSTLAVLAAAPDGPIAGAALGLAAAAALRSRCAVVCLWSEASVGSEAARPGDATGVVP